MIKNADFINDYLNKIIIATEQHPIDEWLNAFKALSDIKSKLNLDIHNIGTETLKTNLAEDESQIAREAIRLNSCTESIIDSSIKIIQISSKEEAQYDDVSELIRNAWWELISFFDYSPDLYINVYTLCLFNNLALMLEKSVKIAAERFSNNN